jgi:hypothetical protein
MSKVGVKHIQYTFPIFPIRKRYFTLHLFSSNYLTIHNTKPKIQYIVFLFLIIIMTLHFFFLLIHFLKMP